MPEPMVDKSVDENLAAEAEKLLAQEVESAGEAVPAAVEAAEAEADLSSEVERLLAQQNDAGGGEGLDADLAALTQSLLEEQSTTEPEPAAEPEAPSAEAVKPAADATATTEVPGDLNGEATAQAAAGAQAPTAEAETSESGTPEVQAPGAATPAAASTQAKAAEAKTPETKPQATEEELHEELDAAAQQVEIPPAPEPTLPPAEAVGKAAAESIAAQAEAGKPAKAAAVAAVKETKGATLEDLKPSIFARALKPLSGAVVGALAMMSKPLADKPSVVRDSIGWLSVSTLFCGASLWGYALVFRKPPEPPKPHDPVALVETADAGHVTYAKRSTEGGAAGGGHGEAKKDAGHGEKKEEPKKAEAKKDAGHGAAKKAEPKKTEAKKAGGH